MVVEFADSEGIIGSLRTQIEVSRRYSIELASQFQFAVKSSEKTEIAQHFDRTLKLTHTMQLLLEMLERKQFAGQSGTES